MYHGTFLYIANCCHGYVYVAVVMYLLPWCLTGAGNPERGDLAGLQRAPDNKESHIHKETVQQPAEEVSVSAAERVRPAQQISDLRPQAEDYCRKGPRGSVL